MDDAVGAELVRREHAAEGREERLDVRGVGSGISRIALELCIGRSQHEHALPGDRARTAGVVEERDPGAPVAVEREKGVHSLAQPRQRPRQGILEATDRIEPRTGRAHDGVAPKRQPGTRLRVLENGRSNPPARPLERDNPDVVERDGPRPCGGAHRRERQARVVRTCLVDEGARTDRCSVDRRERRGERGPQQPWEWTAEARHQRVDGEAGYQLRDAARVAALDDEQQRKRTHEVRSDAGCQGRALVLQLADEAEVARGEVTEATVQKLRRRGRGLAAKVARIDEGDPQAPGCRLVGDPASDDAGADH